MLASRRSRKAATSPLQARTPRPKGGRWQELAQGPTTAKPPARWLTYLGLITSFIAVVVSIAIAIGTTRSNHQFEKTQAARQTAASQQQAARDRKYVAYPKLETDLAALEDAMLNCHIALTTPIQPGQKYITNPTDQQAWIEQNLVTPVKNASDRIFMDYRTAAVNLSPAVEKLLKEMQEQQLQSAETCRHFNEVLVQYGNEESPAARKDEKAVSDEIKKQRAYVEDETTKITDQINRELQTD